MKEQPLHRLRAGLGALALLIIVSKRLNNLNFVLCINKHTSLRLSAIFNPLILQNPILSIRDGDISIPSIFRACTFPPFYIPESIYIQFSIIAFVLSFHNLVKYINNTTLRSFSKYFVVVPNFSQSSPYRISFHFYIPSILYNIHEIILINIKIQEFKLPDILISLIRTSD